jgi:hypothetical protein
LMHEGRRPITVGFLLLARRSEGWRDGRGRFRSRITGLGRGRDQRTPPLERGKAADRITKAFHPVLPPVPERARACVGG